MRGQVYRPVIRRGSTKIMTLKAIKATARRRHILSTLLNTDEFYHAHYPSWFRSCFFSAVIDGDKHDFFPLASALSPGYNRWIMSTDAYQQTLDYLYSFVDYSLTRSFRYTPDKFDLGRMFELMSRLGKPELKYPSIHIAGTKGKGSVAALCQGVLQAAGYKTGLYTSPHLHDYAERIQV